MDVNEIREKIKKEYMEEFRPIAEGMAKSGVGQDEIVGFFLKQVELKTRQFYNQRGKLESFREIFKKLSLKSVTKNADSRAEQIFCEMLADRGIKYKFQVQIGPFRADYLIDNYLIVELDGPQHDKEKDKFRDAYLARLGYRTIRIPLWLLTVSPDAVIDEIKAASNG